MIDTPSTKLLFDPARLVERAKTVKGFSDMCDKMKYESSLYATAQEIAEEWTSDWDEGQGFGSSDFTATLKEFIDTVIRMAGGDYKTVFTPCLTVVEETVEMVKDFHNTTGTRIVKFKVLEDEYTWYAEESADNAEEIILRATKNGKELFPEVVRDISGDGVTEEYPELWFEVTMNNYLSQVMWETVTSKMRQS